jgi:low temperature requirement protein LtrA
VSHGGPVKALTRMRARLRDEQGRTSTPLELFFDLCFVVAVAQAGAQLVHYVAEGDAGHGLLGYLLLFFAIWWAWMNFTWFASAYDVDDVPYRLATLVQITGVLVLAAGVPRAFAGDFTVAVIGYLIMRVALTFQWLRAARGETGPARKAALRYAGGLVLAEFAWVGLLLAPDSWWIPGYFVLVGLELAVPAFAERAHQTAWHPHHIGERYGLFTIIVLGETIFAATVAVQSGITETGAMRELLPIAAGGLVIVFAAFWIYFASPIHEYLRSDRQAFIWGYGHFFLFGAAAAIGAGIEVVVEEVTHKAHISTMAASLTVTAPTALFMMSVWLVHSRHFKRGLAEQLLLPMCAVLVLLASYAGHWAVPLAGLVAAATVGVGIILEARRSRAA